MAGHFLQHVPREGRLSEAPPLEPLLARHRQEALADDAEIGALAPPHETLPLRDQQLMGHVRVGHDDHATVHDAEARNAAVAERQIGHEEMRRPRKRRSGPQERKSSLLMHARHLHLPCVPPLLGVVQLCEPHAPKLSGPQWLSRRPS